MRNSDSIQRACDFCETNVINTQNLSDEAVLAIVLQDTSACLKLDLNDSNIRIINQNVY